MHSLRAKRIENILIGVTFINFAIIHLIRLYEGGQLHDIVRIGTISCNLLMGYFIIFSQKHIYSKTLFYQPYWLGMLVCNIIIVKNTTSLFSVFESILFTLGLLVVFCSVISLNRSFALAPALIKLKKSFLYSIIRHPMYCGEMLMIAACVLNNLNLISILTFLTCSAFMIKRIQLEEEILSMDPKYSQYIDETKWKLLPYIW